MKHEYKLTCAICGHSEAGKGKSHLWQHIQLVHGITPEEYFKTYIIEPGDPNGTCMLDGCDNKTKFKGINIGYVGCCCRNHQLRYAWSRDQARHERQGELGKRVMADVNKKIWADPEFRKRHHDRMSKLMTAMNYENWSNPEYYERHCKMIKNLMSKVEFKSYLDKMRFTKNYDEGLFYIIIRDEDFKIGVTHCKGDDMLGHMWSKWSKYGNKHYYIWYGTAEEITDVEYWFKVNYESCHGWEFFSLDKLDEFLEIVKSNQNLKPVKSA